MEPSPLQDRLIALPEMRELDVFAALLERRGARVLRAPLVAIRAAPDPQPVLQWLRRFCAGECQDLVLLTGEGLRRLAACIDQHEPALRAPFLAALAAVRKITRGPKPARALRELGLASDLEAEVPTTPGIIATLARLELRGHVVGVQLYGTEANQPLQQMLRAAGAEPLCVAPYVYADAADDAAVRTLLARLRTGEVDAIAFTSKAQVARLFAVADAAEVRAALAATQVAAVGPVVADALRERGVSVGAMPESNWFMKPLSAELARLMAGAGAARSAHTGHE
ncbi:MAG TPA: uroporphyrinogen-III synthase [Steroidobacteraceae bacterium]|nr:uroporphyrinogen-III synthase [Steroidobacteraceae bacterium]